MSLFLLMDRILWRGAFYFLIYDKIFTDIYSTTMYLLILIITQFYLHFSSLVSDTLEQGMVNGLLPDTTYSMRMLAVNQIESSSFTDSVVAKTNEEGLYPFFIYIYQLLLKTLVFNHSVIFIFQHLQNLRKIYKYKQEKLGSLLSIGRYKKKFKKTCRLKTILIIKLKSKIIGTNTLIMEWTSFGIYCKLGWITWKRWTFIFEFIAS